MIWSYKRWSNSKKGLLNSHQNIYFYSKSNKFKFNTMYTQYSPTTNVDQILQNREKNNNGITVYKKDSFGNVINNYEKKGVPLSDVWEIPYLNHKARERNGYPTQKPILLLEQIIKISTDENDVILDPFCGSGTTLAAAKLLKREYIGIDFSNDAIELCKKRLEGKIIKTSSAL
ncbi:MAG: site-specific DNA-methyltransferase, partial [Akkermansia sp.]